MCRLSSLAVPIIPTFLYALDHPTQDPFIQPSTQGPSEEGFTLASVHSFYDNTSYSLRGSESNLSEALLFNISRNSSQVKGSTCQEDSAFLDKENVRVGLLFASKALVQLLINPFVGPLTNRYMFRLHSKCFLCVTKSQLARTVFSFAFIEND